MPKLKETYIAIVANTADDQKRGRIKVICPELTGVEDMVIEEWVEPMSDWGWFYVPDIGELVEVEAVVSDDYSESYLQAFLEYPDLRWRGKRGQAESADITKKEDAKKRPPDFMFTSKNYGKRRGFYTPTGHCLMFDDTKGDETVTLSWKINKVSDGTEASKTSAKNAAYLTMDKDGSIQLVGKDGNMVYMNATNGSITVASSTSNIAVMDENGIFLTDNNSNIAKMSSTGVDVISSKDINIIAPENVVIESGSDGQGSSEVKLDIKTDGNVELTTSASVTANIGEELVVETVDNVTITVGGDAHIDVSGEAKITGSNIHLDSSEIKLAGGTSHLVKWEELAAWADGHVHLTAFGPSGPPAPVDVGGTDLLSIGPLGPLSKSTTSTTE